MARARSSAAEGWPGHRDGSWRQQSVAFARDGSVLTIAQRGRWACLTITRDDGGPRALDILLDRHESGQLVRWLTELHEDPPTGGVR